MKKVLLSGIFLFLSGSLSAQIPNLVFPDTGFVPGLLARYSSIVKDFTRLSEIHTEPAYSVSSVLKNPFSGEVKAPLKGPFLMELQGQILLLDSSLYAFRLRSSDGAIVWIDGKKVLLNDGCHGITETEADLPLNEGAHSIRIWYFSSNPVLHNALELNWKRFDEPDFSAIPKGIFRVEKSKIRALGKLPLPKKPTKTFSNGKSLIAKSGCLACHREREALSGPAFLAVSQRYRHRKNATSGLISRIMNGTSGFWGSNQMPPQRQINRQNLHQMVQWILSLK
jgi:cytochrome c551/c552